MPKSAVSFFRTVGVTCLWLVPVKGLTKGSLRPQEGSIYRCQVRNFVIPNPTVLLICKPYSPFKCVRTPYIQRKGKLLLNKNKKSPSITDSYQNWSFNIMITKWWCFSSDTSSTVTVQYCGEQEPFYRPVYLSIYLSLSFSGLALWIPFLFFFF